MRKKVFKSATALLLALLMVVAIAVPAFAAAPQYRISATGGQYASVNDSTGLITISGSVIDATTFTPVGAGKMVIIKVVKDGSSDIFHIVSVNTNASGEFTTNLQMVTTGPSADALGKYNITISGQDVATPVNTSFIFRPDSFRTSFMTSLAACATPADLYTLIDTNKESLNITFEADSNSPIYSAILAKKNLLTTVDEVEDMYNVACVINSLKGATNTQVADIINTNQTLLGLTLNRDNETDLGWGYLDLVAMGKAGFIFDQLSAATFDITDKVAFNTEFEKIVGLGAINACRNWNVTESLYTYIQSIVSPGVFSIDFSVSNVGYTRLANKPEVFRRMFSQFSGAYASYTDVVTDFNSAVDYRYEVENPTEVTGPSTRPSQITTTTGTGSAYIPEVGNQTNPVTFTDIDQVAWARESILDLASRGVVSGTGNGLFEPNREVTREEFVKMILSALGYDNLTVSGVSGFNDVTPGAWYEKYLTIAKRINLVQGREDGSFGVGSDITREEMCTIAFRAVSIAQKTLIPKVAAIDFVDRNEFSEYAVEAIDTMQKANILSGVGDNRFDPRGTATRAMAAKVIYSIIVAIQ